MLPCTTHPRPRCQGGAAHSAGDFLRRLRARYVEDGLEAADGAADPEAFNWWVQQGCYAGAAGTRIGGCVGWHPTLLRLPSQSTCTLVRWGANPNRLSPLLLQGGPGPVGERDRAVSHRPGVPPHAGPAGRGAAPEAASAVPSQAQAAHRCGGAAGKQQRGDRAGKASCAMSPAPHLPFFQPAAATTRRLATPTPKSACPSSLPGEAVRPEEVEVVEDENKQVRPRARVPLCMARPRGGLCRPCWGSRNVRPFPLLRPPLSCRRQTATWRTCGGCWRATAAGARSPRVGGWLRAGRADVGVGGWVGWKRDKILRRTQCPASASPLLSCSHCRFRRPSCPAPPSGLSVLDLAPDCRSFAQSRAHVEHPFTPPVPALPPPPHPPGCLSSTW